MTEYPDAWVDAAETEPEEIRAPAPSGTPRSTTDSPFLFAQSIHASIPACASSEVAFAIIWAAGTGELMETRTSHRRP